MIKIALFTVYLVLASIYVMWRGRTPERLAIAMMVIAFGATVTLPYTEQNDFNRLFVGLFRIDVALFVGLLLLALCANRFWPLWVAALQLLTVAVHLVKSYDPAVLPIVYARVSGEIGYPIVGLLAAGTWRLRDRLNLNGRERDWSPLIR